MMQTIIANFSEPTIFDAGLPFGILQEMKWWKYGHFELFEF